MTKYCATSVRISTTSDHHQRSATLRPRVV